MAVDYTNFIGPLKPTGPAPTGPVKEDPNQDLYNQLLGMSNQRNIAETLRAGIQNERRISGQSYSSMYENLLRSQRMQRGLSDTTGFSGGMAEQLGEKQSAAVLAAGGQIELGRQAAMSNLAQQERMVPFEAARQALEFQQAASAIDPRLKQAEVYAAAGDTQNWANIMNEVYGTTLQYDPETGGFIQGGAGGPSPEPEPEPKPGDFKPPVIEDLDSPTMLPTDKTKAIKSAITEAFGDQMTRADINRFVEYFGEKGDYTNETQVLNDYFNRQLPFEEWKEIDRKVFQGTSDERAYLEGSGGTRSGDRLYFQDPNNEFLLYLVKRFPERFGQDLTPRTTGPSGNYLEMKPEEAIKAYQEFLRNR